MFLENETLKLRAVELADLDLLYEWENAPDLWSASDILAPYSRYTVEQYIQTSQLDIFEAKQLRFMVDLKNAGNPPTTIATVDLFNFEPQHLRAEVGILVFDPRLRQKGYATQALLMLKEYAFEKLLLHQLCCNTAASNTAAIRLFRGMGFEPVGIKKEWRKTASGWEDEILLQIICQK